MIQIAYTSPFVPPEWIAAHQLRAVWLQAVPTRGTVTAGKHRGVCHYADALIERAQTSSGSGIVMTTCCDQMRYAAAYLDQQHHLPVFLLNVPSTWQHAALDDLYRQELLRLGRFLESLGGRAPTLDELSTVMRRYDAARAAARSCWQPVSDRNYWNWLSELRNDGHVASAQATSRRCGGVPLALIGGPLLEDDSPLLNWVAEAGGEIVLDATEWGERTLPASLDLQSLQSDPVGELVRIYFHEIPDIFRRPNVKLYAWLEHALQSRHVRGILYWRRVFCDLWHAELEPMRNWSPVPLMDIEAATGDAGTQARTRGRIEAFLETIV